MKHSSASCAALVFMAMAASQAADAQETLPTITVTAPGDADGEALTVPTAEQATIDIQRTPGAVEVVRDTAFKDGPAQTIKDVLAGVPGVVTQSRWS